MRESQAIEVLASRQALTVLADLTAAIEEAAALRAGAIVSIETVDLREVSVS